MQVGERAYQSFSPEVRQNSNGTSTIKISAGTVDRHGTIIDVRGIDVSAYKANPVVLFNHDYDKIVGRASNIQVRGDYLIADVEWDMEDEFAAGVARKMKAGFLNAASVGFLVQDGEDDEERGAFRITSSELVEFSIVAVPSNRDALVVSRDLKQQVADMKAELEAIKSRQQPEAAEVAPEEYAAEASTDDVPAEAAADSVPAEAAKQETPEPEAERAAPQTARQATQADYEAMAKAMQPVILQSVLRALGKA